MSANGWSRVRIAKGEWYVAPQWLDLFCHGNGWPWHECCKSGKVELVKDGQHRRIYRIQLDCPIAGNQNAPQLNGLTSPLVIYVKQYPLTGFRRWAERLRLSHKSQQECEKFLYLRQWGVPTLQPIACGRDNRAAYLITLALEEAVPLDQWLTDTYPRLPVSQRHWLRLLLPRLLARLIARMHQAGAYHADLHAGNVLIRLAPGKEPELFITDSHEIRLAPRLPWRHASHNLAVFARWFLTRTDPIDRRRFLREYFRYRPELRIEDERQAAVQLERGNWQSLLRFLLRRDKRPWSSNRSFFLWQSADPARSRLGFTWRGWVVRDLSANLCQQIIDQTECLLLKQQAAQLPTSEAYSVHVITPIARGNPGDDTQSAEVDGLSVCVPRWQDRGRRGGFWETQFFLNGRSVPVLAKCFRLSGWKSRLAEHWHLGPASRSWFYAYHLQSQGLPTPRALGLFFAYSGFLPVWAVLVCEKKEQVVDLRQALAYLQKKDDSPQRMWMLIRELARFVARLHRLRLSHRDLKAAHFLVSQADLDRSCEQPQFYLVDLVGLSRPFVLTRRRQIQNLARLQASFSQQPNLSLSDRLRFLRTYLFHTVGRQHDWKLWWREIAHAAKRKIQRNQRLGRPLT